MPDDRSRGALLVTLMSVAMVIWGGTWPAGKIASTAARPEVTVFWRFLVTAVAFVPVLLFMRHSAARSPRAAGTLQPRFSAMGLRAWLYTAAAAASLVGYNMLFFSGLRLGLAGIGGVLVPTLSALVTGLVAMALGRRRPGPLAAMGLAAGLAGGLVILQVWRFSGVDLVRSGNLLFVAAAFAWSAVTIFSQRAQAAAHFATHSFAVYALAAAIALPFALRGGSLLPPGDSRSFWLLVLYLGVVATDFATTCYFLSASRLGSGRASAFMFIVPTAAVLLSWLLLGERPGLVTLAGGALSIAAVYLVNAPQRSP
jgi:drug/metabolite transporter (DMT)-like permease